MQKVSVKLKEFPRRYDIKIGKNLLDNCGNWAKNCFQAAPAKIVLISNTKVFGIYGEAVRKSLESQGFEVFVWLMKDGEKYKNFRVLECALEFISEKKNQANRRYYCARRRRCRRFGWFCGGNLSARLGVSANSDNFSGND